MDTTEYYIVDCNVHSIETGDLVQYEGKKYYFKSHGFIGYLYKDYNDFLEACNHVHSVPRTHVKKILPVGETHVEPERESLDWSILDIPRPPPPSAASLQRAKELSAKRSKEFEARYKGLFPIKGAPLNPNRSSPPFARLFYDT